MRYKLLKCIIAIIITLLLITSLRLSTTIPQDEIVTSTQQTVVPLRYDLQENSWSNTSKLLTLSTTFVDISNKSPNEETTYRYNAQLNFLKTTQFQSFKYYVNFIVFTDDPIWINLIKSEYKSVKILPIPSLTQSAPPLIRDIFLNTIQSHNTPFYMFANGDNLYDFSLIQTLNGVMKAVEYGKIRSKLLIIGQRFDLDYKGTIQHEYDIQNLHVKSKKHPPVAKDYFIVTRNTFEWENFPDFYIGRRWYDSYIVQSAFFNEVELIDATLTIRMIHQVKRDGFWSSMHAEESENDWNLSLLGKDTLSSIRCARYITETSFSEVVLIDKGRSSHTDTTVIPLFVLHNQLVSRIMSRNQVTRSSFQIIILAYNRPVSLGRVLTCLTEADYGNDNVDVTVMLDRGRSGGYDLEVLRVLDGFRWKFGNFTVILQHTHVGALQQWIFVLNTSPSKPLLVLEDNVVLSRYFYIFLKSAISAYESPQLAGFSLDISSPLRDNINIVNYSNIVLSTYYYSRAFFYNPTTRSQFIQWYIQYGSELISQKDSTKHSDYHYIFRKYTTSENMVIGYLVHSTGDVATRAFYNIEGNDEFLLHHCYAYDKLTLSADGPLMWKMTKFSFPNSPPNFL